MMGRKELDRFRFLSSMTISSKDGRLIKIDGNGAVVQVAPQEQDQRSVRVMEAIGLSNHLGHELLETHRTVTGRGTVTRYFHDGTNCIYYASGRIDISSKGDYFYTVNPNGVKELVMKKERKAIEIIQTSKGQDPESGITYLSRKDNFIRYDYPDGSRLSVFSDGTRISSNPERTLFKVHHATHDTVEITYDYFRARNPGIIGPGGAFATKGRENIFERIYDGRLVTIVQECGIRTRVFKEMRELEGYNNFRLTTVTLLDSPDGKVLRLENYGEVVYIDKKDFMTDSTKLERVSLVLDRLEKRSHRMQRGVEEILDQEIRLPESTGETDYFIQMFLPRKERTANVYTLDIFKGDIHMRDAEGNEFTLNKQGKVRSHINVSFNLNHEKPLWDEIPKFEGAEYVDPINFDLPVPRDWQQPFLAMIDKEGKSHVFYEESMVQDYFEDKRLSWSMLVKKRDQVTGSSSMTILTRRDTSMLTRPLPPRYEIPSIFRGLPVSKHLNLIPEKKEYFLRTFTKYRLLRDEDKEILHKVEKSNNVWKAEREATLEISNIFDTSHQERMVELEFQQKLLQLAIDDKNIIVYGQSNKSEISNPSNVVFADS